MAAIRGQHLIGKELGACVLEKLLGYGGSSAVFLAQQHDPQRKVAVKVFLPRPNMDTQMQQDFYNRFLSEAQAASQLDHPNIMPIYAYGEQDGLPYIIMPYMPGGTLSEHIARHGALSLQDAQWYLEQLSSALDYAHQHKCVHCDVKPANILLDEAGHVMLSDFGIARISRGNTGALPRGNKNPDSLMGTPDYISPEQAMGRPLDGRSDIYSLAVTLFYLLANELPFKADTSIALALLHVHEPPPSLALIRPDVSPMLDTAVRKALAKNPDARFQTAGEFSRAFTSEVVEIVAAHEMLLNSGKRAKVQLAGNPGHGSDIRPSVVASEPVVHVKPITELRTQSRRMVGVASLLVAITLIVMLGANLAVVYFVPPMPRPTVVPTETERYDPEANLFTHENYWTQSPPTFTYDPDEQQYHIVNKKQQDVPLISLYRGPSYDDFRLTVTTQQIKGRKGEPDYYGIVFRSLSDQSHYYLFEIITSSVGKYDPFMFARYDGSLQRLTSGIVPSLVTDSSKSNTLTVEAKGNHFVFLVNDKQVGEYRDTTKSLLQSGQVGLFVEREGAEVAFSELFVKPL